jgi:Fe-S-cluster containining protein
MKKVPLQFRVLDEVVSAEVDPIPERMRLDEALPLLRVLDDRFTAVSHRQIAPSVTCTKGCSACCRIQPVPVTPTEAYSLFLLVEAMPEPRRERVRARFAECESLLEEAGLANGYLEGRPAASDGQAQANARKYLDLALVCPFLEGDACSIYDVRPFTCREYFVTSPKEWCVNPLSQPIQIVPRIVSGARAVLGAAASLTGTIGFTLPLTLAMEYARNNREVLGQSYPGPDVIARSIEMLVNSNPHRTY